MIAILAVLFAILPALFAVETPGSMAMKLLQASNKFPNMMTKPVNSTSDNDYALIHYYDTKDCASDAIQYLTYKTGVCYTVDNQQSTLMTCNSGKVRVESWTTNAQCSGASTSMADVSDQCINQVGSYIQAVSYGCASSYVPAGEWYSNVMYTDASCQNMYMAQHMKNQYCVNYGPTMSMKYDYPKSYYYYSAGDCTGASTVSDLTYSSNYCVPYTIGTTQSMQSMFLKA